MDIWKHGTSLDTWSIVHFLSGFLLAGAFHGIGRDFSEALVLSFLLLLLWELFEWRIRVVEPSVNVVMDIVIGVLGFLAGAYMAYVMELPSRYFYAILVVTAALSLWGFMDFKRKGYR
jgi:hypothetical protein